MDTAVLEITFANLVLAFIPALAVVGILYKWRLKY
jgi:hypothetical protein